MCQHKFSYSLVQPHHKNWLEEDTSLFAASTESHLMNFYGNNTWELGLDFELECSYIQVEDRQTNNSNGEGTKSEHQIATHNKHCRLSQISTQKMELTWSNTGSVTHAKTNWILTHEKYLLHLITLQLHLISDLNTYCLRFSFLMPYSAKKGC